MIKVYYIKHEKKIPDIDFFGYMNLFSLEIQNKIMHLHRWQDSQASLLGKILLKRGLEDLGMNSDLSNLKFTRYGKPYLEDSIHFNISHSGHYIVCVFSTEGKIGIDIEIIKPIDIYEFKEQFNEEEWITITSSNNIYASFYYYWTAKEAIIKAQGKGLNIPLKELAINDGVLQLMGEVWYYKDFPMFDNCQLQVASNTKLIEIDFVKEKL